MPAKIDDNTWVYTVITNPGSAEQLLGQHDKQADISYIPIFLEKEHATQGVIQLEIEKGTRYEVQALLYSDVARAASDNGYIIFLLDAAGNVLDTFAPSV
jgi:hypothetical protein